MNGGGSFGANPLRQTIGLGGADEVVRRVVAWPGGSGPRTVDGVGLDRGIRIVEGEAGFEALEAPRAGSGRR